MQWETTQQILLTEFGRSSSMHFCVEWCGEGREGWSYLQQKKQQTRDVKEELIKDVLPKRAENAQLAWWRSAKKRKGELPCKSERKQ